LFIVAIAWNLFPCPPALRLSTINMTYLSLSIYINNSNVFFKKACHRSVKISLNFESVVLKRGGISQNEPKCCCCCMFIGHWFTLGHFGSFWVILGYFGSFWVILANSDILFNPQRIIDSLTRTYNNNNN